MVQPNFGAADPNSPKPDTTGDGFLTPSTTDEAKFYKGVEPVPRFEKPGYHARVIIAEGRIAKEKRTPGAHLGFEILHGPAGTKGRKVFVDGWFAPQRTKRVKSEATGEMISVNLVGEDLIKAKKQFDEAVNRFAKRMGLASARPAAATEEAITDWLKPAIGKEVIVGLSVDRSEEYGDKNRLPSFASVASPDEAVVDENSGQPTGKKLLDVALEAIKKYDENAAKKAGKSAGQTAGAFKAPGASTNLFGPGKK